MSTTTTTTDREELYRAIGDRDDRWVAYWIPTGEPRIYRWRYFDTQELCQAFVQGYEDGWDGWAHPHGPYPRITIIGPLDS